jgi:hypothetical protein
MKLLTQFSSASCCVVSVIGPNDHLSTVLSNTLNICYSDSDSNPNKKFSMMLSVEHRFLKYSQRIL